MGIVLELAPTPLSWIFWGWTLGIGALALIYLSPRALLQGVRGLVTTLVVVVPAMLAAIGVNAVASVLGLGGGATLLAVFLCFVVTFTAQIYQIISIPGIWEFFFGRSNRR